jgi:hypothetical protein
MSGGATRYLSVRQLRGLDKLGDVYLPGDGELPAFSKVGCAAGIDSVLEFLPEGDRKDLGLLLRILGWLPGFLVAAFVWLTERGESIPGGLGALLRFARIGTRGLVMSLYFDHPDVLRLLDYEVGVVIDDPVTAS